jgi:hypothetical protein
MSYEAHMAAHALERMRPEDHSIFPIENGEASG